MDFFKENASLFIDGCLLLDSIIEEVKHENKLNAEIMINSEKVIVYGFNYQFGIKELLLKDCDYSLYWIPQLNSVENVISVLEELIKLYPKHGLGIVTIINKYNELKKNLIRYIGDLNNYSLDDLTYLLNVK